MSLLPDPAKLYAIADRIGDHARAARARADSLGAAAAAASWHGPAAAAFRVEAQVVISGLRSAAGRLDDAADALRRHAGNVGSLLADLEALGLDGAHLLESGITGAGRLIGAGRGLVAAGGGLVGDGLRLVGF
jgi:hypothetical protein